MWNTWYKEFKLFYGIWNESNWIDNDLYDNTINWINMYDSYSIDMNNVSEHTYVRIESNDKNRIWWNGDWPTTIINYDARIYLIKDGLTMK